MTPSVPNHRAVLETPPTDAEASPSLASSPGQQATPPVPSGLRCKLTQALLDDAVLAEDGHSYNQQAWLAYTAAHPHALVSPATMQPVSACVVPNRHLKTLASEWRAWHAAQPPHARPFGLSDWVEDNLKGEVMQQPVALPDGMVCDLSTARDLIFGNPQHPGRSLVDETVTFTASQKVLRDLNVLELSEAVLGHPPGTLPRTYVVPTIAAMLGSRVTPLNMQVPGPAAGPPVLGAPVVQPLQRRQDARVVQGVAGVLAAAYVGVAVAPLFIGVGLAEGAWGTHAPKGVIDGLCIGGPLWLAACFILIAATRGPRRAPPVALGANAV